MDNKLRVNKAVHDSRFPRILFGILALLPLFLPWITLDGHQSSSSGIELMTYALSGHDRLVMWKMDVMSALIIWVLPFLIVFTSQVSIWNEGSFIRSVTSLSLFILASFAFIFMTSPIRDSLGIGLYMLIFFVIAADIGVLIISLLIPKIEGTSDTRRRSRIPPRVKQALYNEFDGKCALCGDQHLMENLEVDHIVPWSKGGLDAYENYQLLCGRCNRLKGVGTNNEARAKLENAV